MRRRTFIAGLGSTAAWPVLARAQQVGRVRRVGILMSIAKDPATEDRIKSFRKNFGSWDGSTAVMCRLTCGGVETI